MNGRPRYLGSLRLAQKSKVFVIIRPIVVACGQILDNLTKLHDRGGLMWVSLCIDGNKYVKSAKPITKITYLFRLCGRFQNKRGTVTRGRRPHVKLVTCGWVGIAQQNNEIDKLFLPYFSLYFVWYPHIQRQTSGIKWWSRQLLSKTKWTWLTWKSWMYATKSVFQCYSLLFKWNQVVLLLKRSRRLLLTLMKLSFK